MKICYEVTSEQSCENDTRMKITARMFNGERRLDRKINLECSEWKTKPFTLPYQILNVMHSSNQLLKKFKAIKYICRLEQYFICTFTIIKHSQMRIGKVTIVADAV